MGDPAGIGPEILIKTLSEKKTYDICRPVVIGDARVLESYLYLASSRPSINILAHPTHSKASYGAIDLIEPSGISGELPAPGIPNLAGGRVMVEFILTAVKAAKTKEIDAMVTCPISKSLMQQAGFNYEGHTQLIADLTDTKEYVMMLAGEKLRVTLVTIHCPLSEVPSILSQENIYKTIKITANALKHDFGFSVPRLAVAALNPHAGEEGLFGSEEELIISPSIRKAIDEGYNVSGPYPPDTIFQKAAAGKFDAVVAMYHDQGLIPLKLLHFSDAVNITLGLPIIRTSVDHGTAYDIAGKGCADPSSLKSAIELAVKIAENRAR
jgi:4-hydroxythreonine-4-phosphate dehydrogenase